jgi:hypothetical protein
MRTRTLILLYIALAVNIALALLPIYDSVNIRSWIALGSSITSASPVMANNIWPGGFFSFMAFTPMYLSYVFSSFNVYLSVVVLKLILFAFTALTAFLLYRITQKVKPAYADTVLLFTLLNPAVLYVNYFWAQIDILPVFFFTLGYALLRFVDFGGNNYKRYIVGFIPILISAFIYRYSLILMPALVFFDMGTVKQRVQALFIAIGAAAVFFVVEYVLYRGGLYNYVGALSGSVINMSGVEGFQYWLSIPLIPYLALLCVLAFFVPLLLKRLQYAESAVLFVILLLFIYTSTVPLADYFLWLYPIGVFMALQSKSRLSFDKILLITSIPVYVALVFISFLIGNGVQSGPFYFAYPLLHMDVPLLAASSQAYDTGVFTFNILLIVSVVAISAFCLLKSNRLEPPLGGPSEFFYSWNHGLGKKKTVIFAAIAIVIVALGFGFNTFYAQPVVATNNDVFPLYLFPANNNYDSMPMGRTYYLSWNGVVGFSNWSDPVSFYHALNLQNINLDLTFNLTANDYGSYALLKTQNYTMGVDLQPQVSTYNLTVVEPQDYTSKPKVIEIPTFDEPVAIYNFNSTSSVNYQLNTSDIGQYYATAFRFQDNNMTQSLLLHFNNSRYIFDYSISNTVQWAFIYDQTYHNTTSAATAYNIAPDGGWNLIVFKPTVKGFTTWVNNESFTVKGEYFSEDTSLEMTSYYTGKPSADVGGEVTQLYQCASMPVTGTGYRFFVDVNLERHIDVPIASPQLNLKLETTNDGGTLNVSSHSWPITPINSVAFGKLTPGVYGLSLTLNHLEISQKVYGYYLIPVYYAVVLPFVAALLCLPLLFSGRFRRLIFKNRR